MQNRIRTSAIATLIVLSCIILLPACEEEIPITPEGEVTTSTLNITGIDGILASDGFEVIVKISESEESVVIETNENLHDFIELNQHDGTLEIGIENHIKDLDKATLKAIVTTPNINQFQATGMSRIVVQDSIFQSTLQLNLSEASTFKAKMQVDKLNAVLSGISTMDIGGYCSTFELELLEASFVDGYSLNVNIFRGDFTGLSLANLIIHEAIYLDANNLSVLRYKGNAKIEEKNLLGNSEIINMP